MKVAESTPRDPDLASPATWASDKALILDYLRAGEPVLGATTRLPDEMDPEQPNRVPLIYYTDGEWIWSGADIYYAEHHDIAVDPELIAHARGQSFTVGEVSDEAVDEAIDLLEGDEDGAG